MNAATRDRVTLINLLLLVLTVGQAGRITAQSVTPVLRGRVIELVDDRGQVRSRLNVEANGEVVLRLLDKNGTIRVKLGAGEGGLRGWFGMIEESGEEP